jgi:hypothetical protein
MVWAYCKIAFAISLPLAAVLYAHELRMESDYAAILKDVARPLNIQWSLEHPAEYRKLGIADARYLHRLVLDLDQ